METYQHRFEQVEDYLHHRRPYLMVDRIIAIREREIETAKTVNDSDFYMQGHFPGAPVFPGAMLQELTTQSAGILIAANYNPMAEYNTHDPFFNPIALGVLLRVQQAKYTGFAKAGDELRVHVQLNECISSIFDFTAKVYRDDVVIMRNAFRLTNIPSSQLYPSETSP